MTSRAPDERPGLLPDLTERAPPREVLVRPRTVLVVIVIVLAVLAGVVVVRAAWQVLTWMLIALLLAIALDPTVRFFERRGLRCGTAVLSTSRSPPSPPASSHGWSSPPLVDQVSELIDAVPGAVDDLTRGRGPLGRLERDYHVVERVRSEIHDRGAGGILGFTAGGGSPPSSTSCPWRCGRATGGS